MISNCPCCKRTVKDDDLHLIWDPERNVVLCDDCGGVASMDPWEVFGVMWYFLKELPNVRHNISITPGARPRKLRANWSPEAVKDFLEIFGNE